MSLTMGVHLIASGEHLHGLGHPHGGLQQSLALWVFAQQRQDLVVVACKLFEPFAVGQHLCFLTHWYATVIFPLTMTADW